MTARTSTNPQRFSSGTGGEEELMEEPADPGSPGNTNIKWKQSTSGSSRFVVVD